MFGPWFSHGRSGLADSWLGFEHIRCAAQVLGNLGNLENFSELFAGSLRKLGICAGYQNCLVQDYNFGGNK